jgi:hypothetical protein
MVFLKNYNHYYIYNLYIIKIHQKQLYYFVPIVILCLLKIQNIKILIYLILLTYLLKNNCLYTHILSKYFPNFLNISNILHTYLYRILQFIYNLKYTN